MPGIWEIANDSHHSYNLMVSDLLKYFDDNGIEKATLLGHSMGGKTVMHFAELHPERVSKLIVADIAPRAYKAHHEHFKGIAFNRPSKC